MIEAVERGDGSMAGEIYDRLLPVVDRTLFRVLGRREHDYEDLVQQSFEQIVATLTTRRYARACSLKSWAASVTTHVGLNALRSRRRERKVVHRGPGAEAEAEGHRAADNPERDAALRREIDELRAHLAAMVPERAEAVILHEVLGHELAEIAALTGVSIAAAQSRLSRGRRDLKERIERGRRGGRA